MDTHREHRIQALRTSIERGDYVVVPARTADAVLGCLTAVALAQEEVRAHQPHGMFVRAAAPQRGARA